MEARGLLKQWRSGAAVCGSGAIAGVVNYILCDDFEGIEVDAQYGDSRYSDYDQKNSRITWGTNFADGRGNVAINAEYVKTSRLSS